MTIKNSFGQYLRSIRENKGWTRVQASMKINSICKKYDTIVSVDSLDKWERDVVIPKIEPVKAMALAYNEPELINVRLDAIEFHKQKKPPVLEHRRPLSEDKIFLLKL